MMPPPSAALVVLGCLILELDKREPGLAEAIVERVESEHLRAAVIKLRGPRSTPEVMAASEEAQTWTGGISLLADAFRVRAPKRGKRRA
jgi:hypothetical protein